MNSFVNLVVFCIAKSVYIITPKLKAALAEMVLRLSVGNWLYSIYGVKLKKHWSDATFRFCANGLYGTYLSRFLAELRPNFSFVDIGANLGLYSLVAARSRGVKKIYAFEPNPFVYEYLVANVALNAANISTYQAAIAASDGNQSFSFDSTHTGTGGLTSSGEQQISVVCRNFSIFDEIQNEDEGQKVVKIDVEGYEPVVIAELFKSKMAASIKFIYFEVYKNRYDTQEVENILERQGFKVLHKEGSGLHYDVMYVRK